LLELLWLCGLPASGSTDGWESACSSSGLARHSEPSSAVQRFSPAWPAKEHAEQQAFQCYHCFQHNGQYSTPQRRTLGKSIVPTETSHWLPTKISIPDINLDAIVVQGIGPEELRQGPGMIPPPRFLERKETASLQHIAMLRMVVLSARQS
jgi:hypothetical protein